LAAALVPLCLLSARVRKVIRSGGIQTWILILWPAATCLMYSLVLFNFRYVAAYLVLICLGAVALFLQPLPGPARTKTLFAAALLLAAVCGIRLRGAAGTSAPQPGRDNATSSMAAAQGLTDLGIRPGDEIAVLGHSLDCYYARLAGVRIVAQIWEVPEQIAGLSASQVSQVLSQLKQAGIKALVSRAHPGFLNDAGWIGIPRTDIYVRML
jgi:hypothetical protein